MPKRHGNMESMAVTKVDEKIAEGSDLSIRLLKLLIKLVHSEYDYSFQIKC